MPFAAGEGARSAPKYTSCANARVIIENAIPMRRIASSPVSAASAAALAVPASRPSVTSIPTP
jgi:hypothetical protein